MSQLRGKGALVWKLRDWCGGDPEEQVAECHRLGLRWVSIKVVDGCRFRWESGNSTNADLLPITVPALRAAGITVVAWGWCRAHERIYDFDLQVYVDCTPVKEARAAVDVCRRLGITHFQVNAEASYRGHPDYAVDYCVELETAGPEIEYSLCSYRFPLTHQQDFPVRSFEPSMDAWAPEVYFLQDNRPNGGAIQLTESVRQYNEIAVKPLNPVAPTYPYGKPPWYATKEQLRLFFEEAVTLGCEGISVWDLPQATAYQKEAIAEFVWPDPEPPDPEPPDPEPPDPEPPPEEDMTRVYTVVEVQAAIATANTPQDVGSALANKDYECNNPPPTTPPSPDKFTLVWPAMQPPVVTQAYGINPQWYKPFGLPGHEGIDMRAYTGSQVFAAAAGTVSRVVDPPDGGPYGCQVRINHQHGAEAYETVYAHFQKALVAVGQVVTAGQVIGLADNTGNSSGAHLHFTLKHRGKGSPWMNKSDIVNPTPYFPDLFPGKGWSVEAASNFRKGPTLNDAVIRLLAAGTVVKALDFGGDGGDWWKVETGGVVGWVWNPGYKLRAL